MDDFITVISLVRYMSGYRTNAYVVAYNAYNQSYHGNEIFR